MVAVLALLVGSQSARLAAQQDVRTFEFSPMWLTASGNNDRLGDRFYLHSNGIYGQDYGMSTTPINLSNKRAFGWKAAMTYRQANSPWGIALTVWQYTEGNKLSGQIQSRPGGPFAGCEYGGIRMWEHTLIPVINMDDPCWASPVSYRGAHFLKLWSADFAVSRIIAHGPSGSLALTIGPRFGGHRHSRVEGLAQTAIVHYWLGPLHYHNDIDIQGDATVRSRLLHGVNFGMRGSYDKGRSSMRATINQAFMFGTVAQQANWHDTDDIRVVSGQRGGPYTEYARLAYLDGKFPFSETKSDGVAVTEASISFDHAFIKGLTLGIGAFISYWNNLPVAARWTVPGRWRIGDGEGWRVDSRSILLNGLQSSVKVSF